MKTLDTALSILSLFASEQDTLSVGEISQGTGLPKSKVSKLLTVYREHGFLEQDPTTRRYKVGLAAFELGSHYVKGNPLARDALPIMRTVVDTCGHSTTLSVMSGDTILHLMAVEGPLYADGRWRVGNRLPAHATSAGKVLLASLSPSELDAFLERNPLKPITEKTTIDPNALREQLETIRSSGCCISRGESAPGLAAIAVPILGAGNRTEAALGLVIPDNLFDEAKLPEWSQLLYDAARRLSMKLGASAYPFGGEAMHGSLGTPSRRAAKTLAR